MSVSKTIQVVALALQRSRDQKYMLARRAAHESGAGHWEFPGGKIDTGETQQQALAREIEEELSFKISTDQLTYVDSQLYDYPTIAVHLHLWKLIIDSDPVIKLADHDLIMWCDASKIKSLNLSPADVYFVDKLL